HAPTFAHRPAADRHEPMRICVVGAGAIGGGFAPRLATVAGPDVSVLARGAPLSAIRAGGLRGGPPTRGNTVTPLRAAAAPAQPGGQDFVIGAVKAQAMPGVAAAVGPLLGPSTAVLSTLNGVPWWFLDGFGGPAAGQHLDSVDPGGAIAAVLPASRVIGGTVH